MRIKTMVKHNNKHHEIKGTLNTRSACYYINGGNLEHPIKGILSTIENIQKRGTLNTPYVYNENNGGNLEHLIKYVGTLNTQVANFFSTIKNIKKWGFIDDNGTLNTLFGKFYCRQSILKNINLEHSLNNTVIKGKKVPKTSTFNIPTGILKGALCFALCYCSRFFFTLGEIKQITGGSLK